MVQRIPTTAKPHRVRVVKLKPYESVQIIRSHSYKEKKGVRPESTARVWCQGAVKYTGTDSFSKVAWVTWWGWEVHSPDDDQMHFCAIEF